MWNFKGLRDIFLKSGLVVQGRVSTRENAHGENAPVGAARLYTARDFFHGISGTIFL